MGSIRIYKNMSPMTKEQKKRLAALKNRKIDLSDIPEITDEEIARFRANMRYKKNLKIAS